MYQRSSNYRLPENAHSSSFIVEEHEDEDELARDPSDSTHIELQQH